MILSVILQIVQTGDSVVADTVQTTTNQVTETVEKLSLWELAEKGGFIMIPLAALLVLAIYIFFERFLSTNKA